MYSMNTENMISLEEIHFDMFGHFTVKSCMTPLKKSP